MILGELPFYNEALQPKHSLEYKLGVDTASETGNHNFRDDRTQQKGGEGGRNGRTAK